MGGSDEIGLGSEKTARLSIAYKRRSPLLDQWHHLQMGDGGWAHSLAFN